MKLLSKNLLVLTILMSMVFMAWSQDGPPFLTVTKAHWNWNNDDGSQERWLELEKAWFDNVTQKNEHIIASGVYYHYYTGDNSEVLFVTVYPSWNAIMEAGVRTGELAEEAWPDEEERSAMNDERNSYYHSKHSDEIYVARPEFSMPITDYPEDPLVNLAVTRHRAFPDDGSDEEFAELTKEFVTNVTHKNPHLVGHYMHRHAWGADGRDMVEVFVVKSLDDVDDMQDAQNELIEAYWPDEEKRKEFFDAWNKYWTPWHADALYQNEPELQKATPPPAAE